MRLALLAFTAVLAVATASSGRITLFHRTTVPSDWTVGAHAAGDVTLPFHVVLKCVAVGDRLVPLADRCRDGYAVLYVMCCCRQQNLDKLDALFWDVSDPNRQVLRFVVRWSTRPLACMHV